VIMSVNFSTLVYLPNFDVWARPIVVNPVASQPGSPPYSARADDPGLPCRGVFDSSAIDVMGLDGMITSDQQTVLDVREVEFSVVPAQGDVVTIPADNDVPDEGDWEVIDTDRDGEGCTTLKLRRVVAASLPFLNGFAPHG